MKISLFILLIFIQNIYTVYFKIPEDFVTQTGANYSLCKQNSENYRIKVDWDRYLRSIGKSAGMFRYLMVSLAAFDFRFTEGETNYRLMFNNRQYYSTQLYYNMFYSGVPTYLDFEYQINGIGPIFMTGPNPVIIFKINIYRDIYEITIPINLKPTLLELRQVELSNSVSFEKGCLTIDTHNNCGKVSSDNGLRIKSPDYENGFNLFSDISENCEIYLNDKKVEKNCQISNKEIYVENFFADGDDYSNKIKICNIINPSNVNEKSFAVDFTDKNGNEFTGNEFVLKAENSAGFVLESVFLESNKTNYPFYLEINGSLPMMNTNTRNFDFLVTLPENYQNLVSEMDINYYNRDTSENLSFKVNSTNTTFKFTVQNQIIDPKKGIKLTIEGFSIPELVGDQDIILRILDNDTGNDLIRELKHTFEIYEEKKKELNVFLTNYNLNSKTSLIIENYLESPYVSDSFDLELSFNNFSIDQNDFAIHNLENFHYQSYDLNGNKLILKGVSNSDNSTNSKKNMKFKLDGFKTHDYDTLNVSVMMKLVKNSMTLLQKKTFIELNPINLKTKNSSYEITSQNELKLKLNFSMNQITEQPLYLRLKTSKDLTIPNKDLCILNSDLPSFQSNCSLYNNSELSPTKQEFILTKISNNTISNNDYYIELLFKLQDYMESKQDFYLDLVPNVNNLGSLSLNEVKTSQKIQNTINFDCPFGCNKCQVATGQMNCLDCEEGFVFLSGECKYYLLNEMTFVPRVEIQSSNYDFEINEYFFTLPAVFSFLAFCLFNYLKNKNEKIAGIILGSVYFLEIVCFGANFYSQNLMNIFNGAFILLWVLIFAYDLKKNTFLDFDLNKRRIVITMFAVFLNVLNFKKISFLLINDIINLIFLNISLQIKDVKECKNDMKIPSNNEIINIQNKNRSVECSNNTLSSIELGNK